MVTIPSLYFLRACSTSPKIKQEHNLKSIINSRFWISLASGLLVAVSSFAHHSSTVFDGAKSIQKTGEVTQFIYRNPHLIINMDVKDGSGKTEVWKIEGQSIAALRRTGFNRDSVSKGDVITVKMRPLKTGKPGGLLQGMVGANGKSYSMDGSGVAAEEYKKEPVRLAGPGLIDYVPPPAGETLQDRERKTRPAVLPIVSKGLAAGDDSSTGGTAGALDPENLAKGRTPAGFDLTGVWQYRGEDEYRANYGSYEFKPRPELTPKAQAYYKKYQETARSGERFDDPTIQCFPVGMPRLMTRYGSMMMLQYPTAIYMLSRLSNEYRVIYLDDRDRIPARDLDRNWGGESLGHWEADTLVVETTGFIGENHLVQAGVKASKQFKIVERYRMINDGNTLEMGFTMTDPENWVGEWSHVKYRDRVLRSDVKEANCIYTDNLALPGH